MALDDVVELLDGNEEVSEGYVLVRELKLYLDLDHEFYSPRIRIKIWKSSVLPDYQYHFTVSHHVHTPLQATPYHPSRTSAESEAGAIREALSTTTSFLKSALREGHEPDDRWLVPNEDF